MATQPNASMAEVSSHGGRFSWLRSGLWLVAAPTLGALAAWGATLVEVHWAGLVLFPLLVGFALAAMLGGLLRVAEIGHRPTLWTGAVLAAAVAIVGQHYLDYRQALDERDRQDAEQRQKAQEAFPKAQAAFPGIFQERHVPRETFLHYMRSQAEAGRTLVAGWGWKAVGGWAWVSWAIDALLLAGATIALLIPAVRQPYCNQCRTWYRTIRSGRIAPDVAVRLAEIAGEKGDCPPVPDKLRSVPDFAQKGTVPFFRLARENVKAARCRLSNCSRGCGPTRLELSWEETDGRSFLSTAWLDREGRDRAGRALDEGPAN